MLRQRTPALVLLLALLCGASGVFAQDGSWELSAEFGYDRVVRGPFTLLRVGMLRSDDRPFSGRLVVQMASSGPRAAFGDDRETTTVTEKVALDQGELEKVVVLAVPVDAASGSLTARISLEAAVGQESYTEVASIDADAYLRSDATPLVGFLSVSRLGEAQPWLAFDLHELSVADIAGDWRALAGFDAILLNREEGFTSAQYDQLMDYVSAGGTLILSPVSTAGFSAGAPAAELLRISAASGFETRPLTDFPQLDNPLRRSGLVGPGMGESQPGLAPEAPVSPSLVGSLPRGADADDDIRTWKDAGLARAIPAAKGLISVARVGAGLVVFLHADLSSRPLIDPQTNKPTKEAANLLTLAVEDAQNRGMGRDLGQPLGYSGAELVDIAGKRIPDFRGLIVGILVYILLAGGVLFLVARKLRRPELYPLGLLLFAGLSVLGVFGVGSLWKTAGERARVMRVIVSDDRSGRHGVYSVGCSYLVDGDAYRFLPIEKSVAMAPGELGSASGHGMAAKLLAHRVDAGGSEQTVSVEKLDQWQNLYYAARQPLRRNGMAIRVRSLGGAWEVENLSNQDLRACVILVGGAGSSPGSTCDWHYLAGLGSASGADHTASLASSSRAPDRTDELLARILEAGEDGEFETSGLLMLVGLSDDPLLNPPYTYELERRTLAINALTPADGEFLMLAVLPSDAVSTQSLGIPEEDDDILQSCLWVVRGYVE